MKKYKLDPKSTLYEVVVPFGEGASEDGLFDDCPLCQELRRELERGLAEEVVIHVEDDSV